MFGTAESASLIYYVQADLSSTFFQNSQYFLRYPGSHILAEDLHGKMTVVIGGWARDVEDAVPYGMKDPLFQKKQGISKILFVPIRRADHSDRSGGFTRLMSSKIHQARVCPRALPGKIPRFRRNGGFQYKLFVPIRRADHSDRSGGFTRLMPSKIHQARVCQSALPT